MKRLGVFMVVLALMASMIFAGCEVSNIQVVDTTLRYDYAWISLPSGEVVEGTVESWRDFEDGDQIQIKINGTTYLTDTTRAVLAKLK